MQPTRFTHDDIDTKPSEIFPKILRFLRFSPYRDFRRCGRRFSLENFPRPAKKVQGINRRLRVHLGEGALCLPPVGCPS